MKKRFFTFLMAVWALLSISQTVKAADDVYLMTVENINGTGGSYNISSNHKMDLESGDTYKIKIGSNSAGEFFFRVGVNSSPPKQFYPSQDRDPLDITEEGSTISAKTANNSGGGTWKVSFDKNTYEYITIHVVIRGETKVWVDGKKKGSGTVTPPTPRTPTDENPIDNRKYSEGYYLVGNFFNFDGDNINYKDAVFKFQQQGNDTEGNAVYMVEIPASLTAHAQVMSVDEFGKPKNVYGPGSAYGISRTCPETDKTIIQSDLKSSETLNETLDGDVNKKNYWNIVSRNESETEYSDGMYKVSITVDKKSGEPSKCEFKHISNKRVAFFISDAKNATAMPVYDTYKTNVKQFSDKFFASVNLSAEHSYYVISNYVMKKEFVDKNNSNFIEKLSSQYRACSPNSNAINCPTTNKLFLLGNGGHSIEDPDGQDKFNRFSPNEEPMKPSSNELGSLIIEYNPSNGTDDGAKQHLGICGRVLIRDTRAKLTSVSLVGDAIPGTLNADGSWNYKSNVADMTFDETEQCYKATVVTTVDDDGKSKFRFVGNRVPQITWYENTNNDEKEMAKHPHDSKNAPGHTADANDPNQVNYTQKGENSEEVWNIIWNRPAGRWTVRLYFYTYSDGNDPKTDYYYTITESRDMELHDVEDVVYGTSDNKQNITNLGGYKFMRTWSAKKAWKISDKVDIFVVSGYTDVESGVKMILTKINGDEIGADNVIPANTGVILATKYDASDIPGAQFKSRQNYTSYNNLVIPMEQYDTDVTYTGDNLLKKILVSSVIPSSDADNYNYLFGYYNTQIATGDKTHKANEYLLGFWISKGSKPYSSNSSYLQIDKETAAKMKYLGTSYKDYVTGGGSAKKIPAFLFDFANVGGTTGINEVVNQSTKLNDGKYYTLSGQQVEKPTAGGIYIHNGRKFVVK